jgi:1,4-alpha-glucan branching enzyme
VPVGDPKAGPPRWRVASVLQFCFPGAPMIYYGDEMGMFQTKGHGSLAPMWWPDLPGSESMPSEYQYNFASLVQFLGIRRDVDRALRHGKFRSVLVDEERGLLAFARALPGEEVILLVNCGKKKQKVLLPAGKPGNVVGVLGPRLTAATRSNPGNDKLIRPLGVGGSRRVVDAQGQIRLWLNPMTVRLVLVRDQPPQ